MSLLLAALAFSGCISDDDGGDAHDDHMDGDHMDGESMDAGGMDGDHMDAEETSDESGTDGSASGANFAPAIESFDADNLTGEAPFEVTFSYNASDANGDLLTWTLDANGDGVEDTSGTEANLPGSFTTTFSDAGTYEATFVVDDGVENNTATLTIEITEPAGGDEGDGGDEEVDERPAPETHFEFGPSLGCVTEAAICLGTAIAANTGEMVDGVDGFFIPLDDRYWNAAVTSTIDGAGDSDCWFLDADYGVLGEANNGGGPCEGTVASGSVWMYLFPWGAPAAGMTLDFDL